MQDEEVAEPTAAASFSPHQLLTAPSSTQDGAGHVSLCCFPSCFPELTSTKLVSAVPFPHLIKYIIC